MDMTMLWTIFVLLLILWVLGVMTSTMLGGFIPHTSRDVVFDVGPITPTAESNRTWPVPAAVSGLAVVCGILLIVFGSRKG